MTPASGAPRAIIDFPCTGPLRFQTPARERSALAVEDVPTLLAEADREARAGRWVVCFVAYEAAPAFDRAFRVPPRAGPGSLPRTVPLAWMAVFDAPQRDAPEPVPAAPCRMPSWTASDTRAAYDAAVAAIREAIARGDVYQVNHTLRLHARITADPVALHRALCASQGSGYCAFLDLGETRILSASPELFFQVEGRRITMRPMKGTARRGRWLEEDDAQLCALRNSAKDRAENVMIVDLLRNDVGRIAVPGSVRVPRLFHVERYRTVLQATSTVIATMREGIGLPELFAALFPCGSVTGAPKVAAMRMIAELESEARQAYCGAIGLVRPGGDATFNVAIRTVTVDAASGHAVYGAGGGITWDSVAEQEYDEVAAKSAILSTRWPEFELLETMRMERGRCARMERHLGRLADSAAYFGFANPAEGARAALATHAASHPASTRRVRLLAGPDGGVRVESVPLEPRAPGPLPVALARTPISSRDPFLFHKTTQRAAYDAARTAQPRAFDVLLHNERGEVTEFTIGNLVLERDGARWTPPRDAGLLAGIFRHELLHRGEVGERPLTPDDVRRAERLWLVNSVREWVAVVLVE